MNGMNDSLILHRSVRNALGALSLLSAFGFITNNLGPLAPELSALLALLSLTFFVSLHFPKRAASFKGCSKTLLLLGVGALTAAFILWMIGGQIERCLAVVFLLLSLSWISKAFGDAQATLSVSLLAALLISLYVILYQYVPPLWFGVQATSRLFSQSISHLVGKEMQFGATASGFHLLIFFLLYTLSFFWLVTQRSGKALLGIVGLGIFVHALYLIIHDPIFVPLLKLFENPYHVGHSHYRPYTITALNTPIFFLGLLWILLFLLVRTWSVREPQEPAHRSVHMIIGAGLVGLGMIVLTYCPIETETGGKVLLYDRGVVNWDRPVFGKYGERSGGMFGMLPEFLQAAGFIVKQSPIISDAILNDCRVLVIINLQHPFAPEEHAAIWRFVRKGGALLALGDHTGLGGIREPLNELLRPAGIEFRFDSAHYIGDWDHAFEILPHPTTRRVLADRGLGISVGASLKISASVTPVVIGKYGFSDLGNANNTRRAFLGDRTYNPGEALGDLVLVAATRYGRGKVMVFGDTSPFQNGTLVKTHRFVRNVFDWLATRSDADPFPSRIFIGLSSLLAGSGLLMITAPISMGISSLVGALLSGVIVTGILLPFGDEEKLLQGKMAYIDLSHLERVNLAYWDDDAFLGLSYNLMRNGFLPLEMDRFSEKALRSGEVFIVLAPTKPFSRSEVRALTQYVREGGTVLWCTGWEEARGSQRVLQAFGFELEDIPLGPVRPESNTAGLHFYKAWPIRLNDQQRADVLCSFKEPAYPLIVERVYGSGRFILVGDAGFLLNANLESLKSYRPENIAFLKELLRAESGGERVALKTKEE